MRTLADYKDAKIRLQLELAIAHTRELKTALKHSIRFVSRRIEQIERIVFGNMVK